MPDPSDYAMPPEWAPQACVWLVPPHNHETWPGCFDEAAAQFAVFMDELAMVTPVSTPGELGIATNDSWVRDFGPVFVVRTDGVAGEQQPSLLLHDFVFNGWGGKYEQHELDNAVPTRIAEALGLPVVRHGFVLEGGSIEVNGRGTVMTTEQCLLNGNRNPDASRRQIEARLHQALGTRQVIWLPGGIEGDDTDGHIDDVARFVRPDTVLAISAPPDHPDHAMTRRNLGVLRAAHDQDGQPLRIIELPVPDPMHYDYPADRFGPGGVAPLPASYANFLISNAAVFVPVFGQPADDTALRIIDDALPDHRVVPIRSERLVIGLGALHCLSMQQPAV